MKINRNMIAVNANKQLMRTEGKLQVSMQRLSSGYKINSAKDNPAGMAISNKMRAQIAALDQATSNASDAQNVMNIADGALNEVTSIVQRMRELAVQAANGTNTQEELDTIQGEIDQLKLEVDRISADTEYNSKGLLDGSSDTRVYTRELDASGNATLSNSSITRFNMSDKVTPDKYEITVQEAATQASASIADAPDPIGYDGYVMINSVKVELTADMSQADYQTALQDAATAAGCEMEIDGGEIKFTSLLYGEKSEVNITLSEDAAGLAVGSYEAGENGQLISKNNGTDAVVTGGSNLDDKIIKTDGNRVYVTSNNGFAMDFLLSSDIDVSAGAKTYEIDVTDIGNMTIQVGANQYQEIKVRIPSVSTEAMYLDGANLDVSVSGGAKRALDTLDAALQHILDTRSRIGAFSNRLEYATSSLTETSENMTGAYSNLVDTDMAKEMTEYAAANILDQAGISVLSQANDLPQQVLSLLSK